MIKAPKGVRALFSDVNKVGKRIKASKKKYTWKFSIDSREHTVDMYVSSLSGKRKVLVDGDLRYNGKSQAGVYFQFPIKIERVMVVIEQMEDSWDLKIGGVSFSQLTMMRQSGPEVGEKSPTWGAQQEWKEQKDSEFGQVHNKWDDWDEKPKPKASPGWAGHEDRAPVKESWERDEPWEARPPPRDDWEEPKPKPRQQDYGWEPTPHARRDADDDDDRFDRRGEERRTDDYYREERRHRQREEEQRARQREDDYRPRRDDDLRSRPRDDDPRSRPREDDRVKPREDDPWRARGREDDYDSRYRKPSPPRRDEYREPRRPPPRDEYEKPKQDVDPFGINEPGPQRKPPRADDYEEDDLYPSLPSIDSRRQTAQAYPSYQAPPSAPQPPAADPFGAPLDFTPPPAGPDPFQSSPFDSKPTSTPFAPAPVDFTVSSSKPFDDDFFGGPRESAPPRKAPEADLAGLVDLDGLNLGDDYSPAVMRKREEQNKAVTIGVQAPNVPMNQLKPAAPQGMQTMPMGAPMAAPMMPNPMAAAMMMQTYMTGMMMNSMMMNQGGAQPRYY